MSLFYMHLECYIQVFFFKYIRAASSWEGEIEFNMGYLDFRFRAQETE